MSPGNCYMSQGAKTMRINNNGYREYYMGIQVIAEPKIIDIQDADISKPITIGVEIKYAEISNTELNT